MGTMNQTRGGRISSPEKLVRCNVTGSGQRSKAQPISRHARVLLTVAGILATLHTAQLSGQGHDPGQQGHDWPPSDTGTCRAGAGEVRDFARRDWQCAQHTCFVEAAARACLPHAASAQVDSTLAKMYAATLNQATICLQVWNIPAATIALQHGGCNRG